MFKRGVKTADKKVRKFLRNCLTGLPQQVLGLVLKGKSASKVEEINFLILIYLNFNEGAVKQVKRLCIGGKKQKELFKHSKCGNSNLQSDHDCMDHFVDRLKDAATNLPDDLKLGSSCCSFIQFEKCIVGRMEKEAKCSKEDVEHFRTIVHSTASEAMDFSCAEYNSNASKCDHINDKLKNGKKSDMKAKSIMVPLIHLISKIA